MMDLEELGTCLLSDVSEVESNSRTGSAVRSSNRFKLPFDWSQHFVWSKDGTKCLGACALMAIRYWGVPLTDEECQDVLSRITVPAFTGADLRQVLDVVKQVLGEVSDRSDESGLQMRVDDFVATGALTMPSSAKTKIPLKQEFFHAKSISSLKEAFKPAKPIPQIVIYDDFMAEYNEEGSAGHASIVEELNFDTEFVYLIDPKAQKRKKASYLSFDDFEKGWKVFEQTAIILYPATFYRTIRNLTSALGMGQE
jgi:hypothetical protein